MRRDRLGPAGGHEPERLDHGHARAGNAGCFVRERLPDAGAGLMLHRRLRRHHPHPRGVRALGAVLSDGVGGARRLSDHAAVLLRGGNAMSAPSWDAARAARRNAEHRAATDLAALYRSADAAYAPFSCPATAECCQLAARGREPWLWEVEWAALRSAVPSLPSPRPDGGCPFLDPAGKRCTAYLHRPLGCRTYFCHRIRGPAHQPIEEMDRLQRRLETVARTLNPDEEGPRPLTAWYGEASS